MDTDDRRRRIKAARALTPPTAEELERRKPKTREGEPGITTHELADRINQPGLAFKTVGNIERGDKTPNRGDLLLIAEATGLPIEFFTLEREDLLTLLEQDLDQFLERWQQQGESRAEGKKRGRKNRGEG